MITIIATIVNFGPKCQVRLMCLCKTSLGKQSLKATSKIPSILTTITHWSKCYVDQSAILW